MEICIHILTVAKEPPVGSTVVSNCGKKLPFEGGIEVRWDDGRVCNSCFSRHRNSLRSRDLKTFAFVERKNA